MHLVFAEGLIGRQGQERPVQVKRFYVKLCKVHAARTWSMLKLLTMRQSGAAGTWGRSGQISALFSKWGNMESEQAS